MNGGRLKRVQVVLNIDDYCIALAHLDRGTGQYPIDSFYLTWRACATHTMRLEAVGMVACTIEAVPAQHREPFHVEVVFANEPRRSSSAFSYAIVIFVIFFGTFFFFFC